MSHLLQQLLGWLMEWQGSILEYGWLGLAGFAIGLAALQMALVPLSIFAIAAGAIFGFEKAFLAITVGTNLGASVNFLISRYVARGTVSRFLANHEKFRLIDAAIGREGGKIVALLRLCPLPFGLSNYCYGLTSVRYVPYALATFFAIIPGNLIFPWLGASAHEGLSVLAGAGRPRHPMEYVMLGVGIIAAFAALSYVARVAKAAISKTERVIVASPLGE